MIVKSFSESVEIVESFVENDIKTELWEAAPPRSFSGEKILSMLAPWSDGGEKIVIGAYDKVYPINAAIEIWREGKRRRAKTWRAKRKAGGAPAAQIRQKKRYENRQI